MIQIKTDSEIIEIEKFVTVRQYATKKKKTSQWAYDQIKKGKARLIEIAGVKFIVKK